MKKYQGKTFTYKKTGIAAKLVTFLLSKVVVRKMDFVYHDEKPAEASIFVGNHTRFCGPLAIQYKYPEDVRTWSEGKLIDRKSCYDLFKNKVIKNIKGERFYRLLLPLMIPLISWYYRKQLNCIPVYHDMKITKTFNESVSTLDNGVHVAIYPEVIEQRYNEVICKFATGFIYLAYNYYKLTGKRIKFYPLYIAETLRQTHFGKPIEYDPDRPIKEQSMVIAKYLEDQITALARSLPRHKIVSIFGDYKQPAT